MTRLVISDGSTSIAMPEVKAVRVGGREVAKEVTMASGRVVKYVQGHRASVAAEWDWVPAETLAQLAAMLRRGGFFRVDYPAPDGAKTGLFSIRYPTMGIFAFREGVPHWHDVKLTMEAQGVSGWEG